MEEKTTTKTQKTHCFWGVHHYETIDTQTIMNSRGDEVGRTYIQQCTNCGKIRATHIRFYE